MTLDKLSEELDEELLNESSLTEKEKEYIRQLKKIESKYALIAEEMCKVAVRECAKKCAREVITLARRMEV